MANDTESLVATALATDLARTPFTKVRATDTSKQQKQKKKKSKVVVPMPKGASLEDVADSTSFMAGVLERVEKAELSRCGGIGSSGALGLGNDGKRTKSKRPSSNGGGLSASVAAVPTASALETPSKKLKQGDGGDSIFAATPKGLPPPTTDHLHPSPPSAASISSLAQSSSQRMFAGSSPSCLYPLPPNPSPAMAAVGIAGSSPLTPDKGTSLWDTSNRTLMQNDLEAISALNLLGNSPALSRSKSEGSAGKCTGDAPKKSLFAKVVEGTKTAPAPSIKGATTTTTTTAGRQSNKRKLKF